MDLRPYPALARVLATLETLDSEQKLHDFFTSADQLVADGKIVTYPTESDTGGGLIVYFLTPDGTKTPMFHVPASHALRFGVLHQQHSLK